MKKNPPQIAARFANMIFVLGILFSILLVIYALYKIYNPAEFRSTVFYFLACYVV